MGSKGVDEPRDFDQFARLRALLSQIREEKDCLSVRDLAVNGHDLMDLGISGKDVGRTLNALLEQVLDERLPNEREALLGAVKREELP